MKIVSMSALLCGSLGILQAQDAASSGAAAPERRVVTADSPLRSHDLFDVSSAADVITRRDLDERQVRTFPEALGETAGIGLQKTSFGQESPILRGLTGFRTLLLVDGVRMNHSVYREGSNPYWNTLDPYLVDRIEILRGPGSSLYGSEAMGGTVAVATRRPQTQDPIHVRSSYRWAGAEASYTGRFEAEGKAAGMEYLAGVTYGDANHFTGGRHLGDLGETGYNDYGADGKIILHPADKHEMAVAFQHWRMDDVPRTHLTSLGRTWRGTKAGKDLGDTYDEERDLGYVQYSWKGEDSLPEDLWASVAWQRQAEGYLRETSETAAAKPRTQWREFATNQVQISLRLGTPGKLGPTSYDTAGLDYSREFVDSNGHDNLVSGAVQDFERGDVADDATYRLIGLYLQDERTYWEKLDFTSGVRWNWAEMTALKVDPAGVGLAPLDPFSDAWSEVSGSFRTQYRVTKDAHLIAGVSEGFRTPNLIDTTGITVALSGQTDFPTRNLHPEHAVQSEVGTRLRGDGWDFTGFYFLTRLREVIRRVPTGDLNGNSVADDFTRENFSDGRVHGFETEASCRMSDVWSCRVGAAWVLGTADALSSGVVREEPMDAVNPASVLGVVRYAPAGAPYWAEGVLQAARSQERLSPSDLLDTERIPPGGTPGYAVYGLRGGTKLFTNTDGMISIENITDRDYRLHGSGQNETGTNVVLGIGVKF